MTGGIKQIELRVYPDPDQLPGLLSILPASIRTTLAQAGEVPAVIIGGGSSNMTIEKAELLAAQLQSRVGKHTNFNGKPLVGHIVMVSSDEES